MITTDTTIRRTSNAASRDIAGEVIILSAKDSMLHTLDEVGSAIWNLLDGPRKVEEIVNGLLDQYDVEQGALQKDVIEFLGELMDRKLVEVCPSEPNA
ncbi:MAG: PqqD family protein [Planctomycetes bacterium]|nr:PqqD family protein [Planctomycetota bacterium]